MTSVARLWCVFLASTTIVLFHSNSSYGAPNFPLPPTLKSLDLKSICTSDGVLVSRNFLARTIIDAYKIPQSMVDWNETGTIGEDENTRAVTTFLCGSATTPKQIALCYSLDKDRRPIIGAGGAPTRTSAASAQEKLVQELNLTLVSAQSAAPDGNGGFSLAIDKYTFNFVRRGAAATAVEKRQKPLLANAAGPLVAAVFSSGYYDIKCMNTAPSSATKPDSGRPSMPAAGPAQSGGSVVDVGAPPVNFLDYLRVRGKTDDLGVSRDSDAFTGLTAATLAIVNDNIARKDTFDVHLVVGYAMPSVQLGAGDTVLSSLPFVQYDRDYVSGPNASATSSNVNNLAVGLQESLTFPITDALYANLIVQPTYIWSLRTGAELAKLHLAIQPQPLLPFFGFAAPTGVLGLSATAYVRPVLNITEVVKSASDNTLTQANNFVQGGVQLGTSIFNKDDSSLFNGVSIPIDYTVLYGFSGKYRTIELFTVGLNYTLPKTKYVTLGLSYGDGRNLDTFELQKLYKASIGVKY